MLSAIFGIQRAVSKEVEREDKDSCWWENPELVNGTEFSTAAQRVFSSAPRAWQSRCGWAGLTVWILLMRGAICRPLHGSRSRAGTASLWLQVMGQWGNLGRVGEP